ncbi:MAG: MAPEG family protein [Pseudomonadota bacterium]|nr:MAPEG family protein [Pseudomonadota bacterium]MEE3019532.1 MAPEG family protein [Pseudomonadota bacterium]
MEAAQTSALALYVGLNLLLTFLLALNVVRHRFKGDSVDQVKLEKAVRAHGNNTEYVPIILIGLGVMAMMGASAQTISTLGGTLFVARIFHAYGIQQPKMPNIFGMVGNITTWLVMLCVATTLLLQGIG